MNPNTITKMFRTALFLGISIVAGFSQNSATAPTGAPVATSALPMQRVLTDSTGRKLDATILEKTPTAIKCRRTSDGMEFTLDLAKLSAADQKFLADLGKPKTAPATAGAKAQPDKPTAATTPAKPAAISDKPSKMPFLYWLTQVRVSPNFKIIGREEAGYKIKFLQDGREEVIPYDRLEMIKRVNILSREESGYKVNFLDEQNPDLEIIVPFDQLTETDRKFLAAGPPEIKPGFVWGTPSKLPFYYYLTLNQGGQKELRVSATIISRAVNGYNVSFQPGGPPIPGKPTGTECIVTFDELSKKDREALKWIDDAPPNSIPCLYTLTLPGGKPLTGTITKKSPLLIKFLRASDNKEMEFQISKLSTKDRKVIDGIPNNNGPNEEKLPLKIELTLKTGKKLEATILKRTGDDFSAFTCKKSDGKEVTIAFHELAAETQKELALVVTEEPTPFPMWHRLLVGKEGHQSLEFELILEKTETEIKCKRGDKTFTIPIADLSEESRKFVEAPTRRITGVPRRLKRDITPSNTERVIPAGEVVWVENDNLTSMWLTEGFGVNMKGKDEIGTPRKVDYEIVTSYKGHEYRIPAGDDVYVVKEDATTLTIWGAGTFYAATVTKPKLGTKTVNATQFEMQEDIKLPNLADPPFGPNDTKQ